MKQFTYRLVLLVVCLTGLTIYAVARNTVKCHGYSLSQTAVKSQADKGNHHPVVAFEDVPAGSACNLAQSTHNSPVCAYHRMQGFAIAFPQPSILFSFAETPGKNQLLHIFPFHNFW